MARMCAMRRDPTSAAVMVILRSPKMDGMAQAIDKLIKQARL
jgi:hypothetical protein